MEHTRRIATARAVVMYKNSDIGLSSIFGDNALDSARRAHLVNDANAGGDAAIDKLTAVVDDLNAQRRKLQAQQVEQQKVLREVAAERTTLDAELASVRVSARNEALVAANAARSQAARSRAGAHVRALASVRGPDILAAPTGPAISASVGSVVVAAPANNGRVSPHHNDPFLVCTRAREIRGPVRHRQPVRLLRRVPIPAVDVGHHRGARRPRRPRRRSPVARVAVRSGRDRVGALPVAGQEPVGRSLLTTLVLASDARARRAMSCRRATTTEDRRARDRDAR